MYFLLESNNIMKFMRSEPLLFLIPDKNAFSIPLIHLLCQYFYLIFYPQTYFTLEPICITSTERCKFAP